MDEVDSEYQEQLKHRSRSALYKPHELVKPEKGEQSEDSSISQVVSRAKMCSLLCPSAIFIVKRTQLMPSTS